MQSADPSAEELRAVRGDHEVVVFLQDDPRNQPDLESIARAPKRLAEMVTARRRVQVSNPVHGRAGEEKRLATRIM
jgi:hypothetical protein